MQKDIHFYLTYTLCRWVDIGPAEAEKIAWANQYTDDLTNPSLHGIQTQSDVLGNWGHRQIQFSVLVPFHFIPGSDAKHPWMTTRNNQRARALVEAGSTNALQFGIALHGLQDTFSHEYFSGWEEDLNSCFAWYYVQAAIPNVGHAELRTIPDVVNYVWTDPRNGKKVDNKIRALAAVKATYEFLMKLSKGSNDIRSSWPDYEKALKPVFRLESYDERKKALRKLSGNSRIQYGSVNKKLEPKYKSAFIEAANAHLAGAMVLFKGLPRM